MQKRLVTRCAVRSKAEVNDNRRRIEGVFAALDENWPDQVSYLVLCVEPPRG